MPDAVIAAIIGAAGVAISAGVSWLISAYQVHAGIKKIRLEMQRVYAERLLDARMNSYSSACAEIENTAKAVQRRIILYQEFQKFFTIIDNWHSANIFVLTAATNARFYTRLRKLKRIVGGTAEAFQERLADHPKRRDLIRDLWVLQLALKSDLGVFELEFFDPGKRFSSYQEVDDAQASHAAAIRRTGA